MEHLKKGRIREFKGSHLLIEQDDGNIISLPCESEPTKEILVKCFGTFGCQDKEIYYSTDIAGVMDGLMKVDDATPELLEKWDKCKREENELERKEKNIN